MNRISIAIAGNPNSGKTSLFNALTGSRQHVGNWPGVTVEKLEGRFEHEDTVVDVVDLPGIYSFSAFSIDESIAREHILRAKPDLVVNIVDATNLERNLLLTTQLIEIGTPMVVVLNMTDIAARRSIKIEVEHLARHLDCPVVPMVATKRQGLPELRSAIVRAAREGKISSAHVEYDSEFEKAIARVSRAIAGVAASRNVGERWLALKLLDGDELGLELAGTPAVRKLVGAESLRVKRHVGEDVDVIITDGRYGFIHGLARDVVHRENAMRHTVSDNIDKVLLSRSLGIPVFLAVMYLVFVITINLSRPFVDFLDLFCGTVFVDGLGHLLSGFDAPVWLTQLLAAGVGGGMRTVATFLPPIFLIFLCLAFLEDSGYMARAAFVMDRFLRVIGLPGKAFIPMLVGFGCNVPAIMATRTLENRRDRIMTIMINPFMSCGARLPVYTLFIAAFFPYRGGSILFGLYFTGIVVAVLTGLLFKRTILAGEASTFVMELPPYHMPTVRGIVYHAWNRLKSFMIRAGKVILGAAVILSLLNSIGPKDGCAGDESADSFLGVVGRKISPVFRPMGITDDNWPAAVGLFTGLFAKEAVVGTLDTLYSQMEREQRPAAMEGRSDEAFDFRGGIAAAFAAIPSGFEGFLDTLKNPIGFGAAGNADSVEDLAREMNVSGATISGMVKRFDGRLGAISYLLFVLIYCPCVAVIAVIYRETNLGWALFAVFYTTLLAWLLATVVYQAGTFSRHPASSAFWLAVAGGLLAALVIGLKTRSRTMRVES